MSAFSSFQCVVTMWHFNEGQGCTVAIESGIETTPTKKRQLCFHLFNVDAILFIEIARREAKIYCQMHIIIRYYKCRMIAMTLKARHSNRNGGS